MAPICSITSAMMAMADPPSAASILPCRGLLPIGLMSALTSTPWLSRPRTWAMAPPVCSITSVMTEVIEHTGGAIAHVRGRESQGVEVSADIKPIGNSPRQGRIDAAEGGSAIAIMAEVIEQIGAIAHVRGGEGQGIKVGANEEQIRDDASGPAGLDRPKTGTAGIVMAEVVKDDRAVAHIGGGKRQGVEVFIAGVEAAGDGAVGVDGDESGVAGGFMAKRVELI